MRFEELLDIVAGEPVFESSLLLAGDVDPADVRRQLSRWARSGKLIQLRRGLYALAPRYRKAQLHPFHVANRLVRPSYVSLQSALSWEGVTPESVHVTTSITTGRPGRYTTAIGDFEYRHIQVPLFWGYRAVEIAGRSIALASSEKALVDLLYLEPGAGSVELLRELRIEGGDGLDPDALREVAHTAGVGKVIRAVESVVDIVASERELEVSL
jgi:predicted transcriptional regulator of viral defense system